MCWNSLLTPIRRKLLRAVLLAITLRHGMEVSYLVSSMWDSMFPTHGNYTVAHAFALQILNFHLVSISALSIVSLLVFVNLSETWEVYENVLMNGNSTFGVSNCCIWKSSKMWFCFCLLSCFLWLHNICFHSFLSIFVSAFSTLLPNSILNESVVLWALLLANSFALL